MQEISRIKADLKIAKKVLPAPLLKAIQHIFDQEISDTVLAGGTALSGFYAGHRRSDDIDLFTKTEHSFKSALYAIESLKGLGAILVQQSHSKQYFRSLCNFENHLFTIDLVLDQNIFRIDSFQTIGSIQLSDLSSLFKMKAATLVSRCSEKDLYDLVWLFEHYLNDQNSMDFLVQSALEIDLGANSEAMLLSLSGAILSQKACNFAIHESPSDAFKKIVHFQKQLIREIREYELGNKNSPLKDIIRKLEKLR